MLDPSRRPPARLDLRKHAAPLELPPLRIADEDREAALTNWKARMVSEHASARVFAELASQMIRANLDRAWTVRAARMVEQELEHGVLCARVIGALGGDPVAPFSEALPRVPDHEDVAPIVAVLRNIVSISCCSETVAVSLVATERERAGAPALRKVLDTILRDEVKHSRLGWKLLAATLPTLSPGERRDLDRYLPIAFEHQVDFHAPFLAMGAQRDEAVGMGAADGPSNWACFIETLNTVIVPSLDALGLDATGAWRDTLAHLPGARRWEAA